MLNQCIEILTTTLEGLLLLFVAHYIVPVENPRRIYHIRMVLSGVLYALIVTVGNEIQLFSTLFVYCVFLVCIVLIHWNSGADWVLCAFSVVCGFLILHDLDLSLNLIIGMLRNHTDSAYGSFWATMNPGISRILFIFISRICQVLLILSVRPLLLKVRFFPRINVLLLFLMTLFSHILIVFFMNQILTASPVLQQICIIVAEWMILAVSLLSVYSTGIASQRNLLLQEKDLLASFSDVLSKSQIRQSEALVSMHRQSHDYTRDLTTLLGMRDLGFQAREYIEQLLKKGKPVSFHCDSGDPYVDAVVNCRLEDIRSLHIHFDYQFFIPSPLPFAAVDICTLLANQLDNAVNACRKVSERDRYIRLTVRKHQDAFLFDTENTYSPEASPISDHPHRRSFGLDIMRSIVEKYHGDINIDQENNRYIVHSTLQWVK